MDTETMIRNLEKVEADHKDDKVFTGQLNIAEMAHDVRKRLEELKPYEDTGLTPPEIQKLKERDTAKAPVQYGEMMMDKKYCGNCFYFNGEKGDGMQFCDEREEYVHESSWCCHHVTDPEKED